jgi:hypothetical protein
MLLSLLFIKALATINSVKEEARLRLPCKRGSSFAELLRSNVFMLLLQRRYYVRRLIKR